MPPGRIFAEKRLSRHHRAPDHSGSGSEPCCGQLPFSRQARTLYQRAQTRPPGRGEDRGGRQAGTPRQRLRTFIQSFLAYLLDPKRPAWQGSLIAREMAQPTPALDRLVAESIEPVSGASPAIVRELVGPDVPETRVGLSCLSIIGQCLHYVHCREMISRLFPKGSDVPRDVETLTDHIYEFSLAGLNAMKNRKKSGSPRRRRSPSKISL